MSDSSCMNRCIELAQLGLGHVAPNPMVGAVLVHENTIIGEGYHKKYGEAHAEVNTLKSVKEADKHLISKSTLYVSLEPCSHFGKTPPCTDLIIKNKIPKVVIGCSDPFEKVAGRGIARLREAGVEVVTGILEKQCSELNKRFFTFHQKKRPYIILKWAQTLNGFMASDNKDDGQWISNDYSLKLVHKWRTEEAAIMVGTNTARSDNPQLTARKWKGRNPVRIVIDKNVQLPQNLYLFDQSTPTIVLTEKDIASKPNLVYEKVNLEGNLEAVLEKLHALNIQSVIVEGGATLLQSFIKANYWDEARIITGDKVFKSGIKAPDFSGKATRREMLHGDILTLYTNPVNVA